MDSRINISGTEQRRKYLLIMGFGWAGTLFLLVFSINAVWQEKLQLGITLLTIAMLGWIAMLMMYRSGDNRYGEHGISLGVILSFIYLMSSGGMDNTGPLWCYPLALMILLLQGFRKGVICLVVFSLITVLLFTTPNLPDWVASYSETFKVRFLASFIAMAVMASIFEYLRMHFQQNFIAISRELDRLARTDSLTGLANRRDVMEAMKAEYSTYCRHRHAFSLIIADLDYFKTINDRYGHGVGDEFLLTVSHMLIKAVRQEDRVARWGGEEFLILLPHTDLQQAAQVAEKLRRGMRTLKLPADMHEDGITASFGVQCISNKESLSALINDTDKMLYEAKRQGRNRVVSSLPVEIA